MENIEPTTRSPVPQWKDQLTMTFSEALEALAQGATITKLEWSNNSIYCQLRNNILMLYRDDEWFQWIINEGDLLGTDWIVRTE